MPETRALTPEDDPRTAAVESGAESTEYQLARLMAVGTLVGSFGLAALAMLALILGKLDLTGLLVLLGVLLAPAVPSAAYVARGYSKDRTAVKTSASQGAAAVAVAEAQGPVTAPGAQGPAGVAGAAGATGAQGPPGTRVPAGGPVVLP